MPQVPRIELAKYRQIVIMTGAGVSVASGLPTYRGVGGLWNKIDVESHATAAAIRSDAARVWGFFAEIRTQISAARPNAAHLAIAAAERRLRDDQRLTVLTQNVDGLHTLAGSSRVVELHGTLRRSRCTHCDFVQPEDLASTPSSCPACPNCSAPLRPDVVLFGEPIPVDAEWASKKSLRECDLFLAVGTSGTVSPASNFVRSAAYVGARTVYINREPMTPNNPAFGETILGLSEEIVPQLLGVSNEAA